MDFTDLERALSNFSEGLKKAVEEICLVFEEFINKGYEFIKNIFDVLKVIEYKEKVRFKPVLKIAPNKIIYPNKRLLNYYCRNNC